MFFIGQQVKVWRRHFFTSNTGALRVRKDRWIGPWSGAAPMRNGQSGSARKHETKQLRLASADEEATADLTSNDDMVGRTGSDKQREFFGSGRQAPGLPEPAPRAAPRGIGFSRRDRIESILDSSTSVSHRRQFSRTRRQEHHCLSKSPSQPNRQSPRLNPKRQNCWSMRKDPNACEPSLSLKVTTHPREQRKETMV